MAAAQSWEDADGLPSEVGDILGERADLLLVIPEHRVPLPGGGRASQCDVFALVRASDGTIALSVEATVNEPFGPTVGEWMVNASAGKIERMRFLCSCLELAETPNDAVRYQLLHRTVAEVIEAERFGTDGAAMIVQSFSQTHKWFEDFAVFCRLFGLTAEVGKSLRHTLPSGRPLTLGWAVGSEKFIR